MKILKAIFRQGVDIGLLIITAGLFVLHYTHGWDVTGMLFILCGYITFNIINKAKLSLKQKS